MHVRVPVRVGLVVLAMSAGACGEDAAAPAIPAVTLPSPLTANLEGEWSGEATLQTPVGGTFTDLGECVQADMNARLAAGTSADRVVLSMSQAGADVTARLNATSTGLACSYTGRAGLTGVALSAASCDAPLLVVRCSQDQVRDLKLVGSSVTAMLDPQTRTIAGTVSNTYNAFETSKSIGVAGVVLHYSYTARKQ